eukprot:gene31031-7123_t
MSMNQPYLQESYKKEFIQSMQAKGKLPKFPTEASDRHDEVYHETRERIFPAVGGKQGALNEMIAASEKRIESASGEGRGGNAIGMPASTAAAQEHVMMERARKAERSAERQALKMRLQGVEQTLNTERALRSRREQELQEVSTRRM